MCAMGLDTATIGGEHEAAEGLADLAGNQYEVGDGCEMDVGSISCCGQSYAIQELAGNAGMNECQVIDSVGSGCVTAPDAGAPADAGSPSGPDAGSGSGDGPPEAGTGSGSGGGRGGGSGVEAGPTSDDASGVASGDAGTAAGDDGGGAQDTFGGSAGSSGCGCVLAGGPSNESAEALVIMVGLLLASLRWMRRNGGAD